MVEKPKPTCHTNHHQQVWLGAARRLEEATPVHGLRCSEAHRRVPVILPLLAREDGGARAQVQQVLQCLSLASSIARLPANENAMR